MEVYVRRYFWVVGALVVAVCAIFAAKGVNHFIEAKYLADRKESKPVRQVSAAAAAATRSKARSKSGAPLVARNMFCSECRPPEPEAAGPVVDSDAPPATGLPLRLVATNVSTVEESSFATVQDTGSDRQGAFWLGDKIPGGGEIVRIRGKYVDFENPGTRRVERLSLLAASKEPRKPEPRTASRRTRPRSKRQSAREELMAAIEDGVNKTGENSWEIDRAVVDKVLANPAAVGRGARIVPSIKNGKPNGFKLYAIRPSSVYSKIGLKNGDTLHSVNGFDLSTPDKALEVYTKVRESSSLQVTITRRGKPVTLKYSIK